jgi:hypothetical protein
MFLPVIAAKAISGAVVPNRCSSAMNGDYASLSESRSGMAANMSNVDSVATSSIFVCESDVSRTVLHVSIINLQILFLSSPGRHSNGES